MNGTPCAVVSQKNVIRVHGAERLLGHGAETQNSTKKRIMPLDSLVSDAIVSDSRLLLGAQRHFAVCPSIFSAAFVQGRSLFHLGRLGLSQLEHPLSALSALSLACVWHDRVAALPCQVRTRCSSWCGFRSAQDQRVPNQVLDSDPPLLPFLRLYPAA